LYPTTPISPQALGTLAWSAGFQAAQTGAPTTATFFDQGWLWWNGLRPQVRLPDTAEFAALAIWNFFQGARYRVLGEAIARHPAIPTGAWCTLFWPTLDPRLPLALEAHARGWMAGARCLVLAASCDQRVLLNERSIRDLSRVEFRLLQSGSIFSHVEEASAFSDGFFTSYWKQAGAWLARAFAETIPPVSAPLPTK
jgi:hypothetical protein